MKYLCLSAFGLGALACGNTPDLDGPCAGDSIAPECMVGCAPPPADNTCPFGFHCNAVGTCDAFCSQGSNECGAGRVCGPTGYCDPIEGYDAAPGPDADCPSVDFTPEQTIPTVQLLVDQSGSMLDPVGSGTRWDSVVTALFDPAGGVVTNLQSQVYFGLSTYVNSNAPGFPPGNLGVCPDVHSTSTRVLNNATAMQQVMTDNQPFGTGIGGTPTAPSVDAVVADFAANPPMVGSPPVIVLATDGQPFTCPNNQDSGQAQLEVVAAAQAAFTAGIRLFILAVGDGVNIDHQQKVANAGAGQDPDTGNAPLFRAETPADLTTAFGTIINSVQSCQLEIDGQIDPAQAGTGTVRLNGFPLMFGTDWIAVDGDTLELIGQACIDLKSTTSPNVTANFPCGAVIIE